MQRAKSSNLLEGRKDPEPFTEISLVLSQLSCSAYQGIQAHGTLVLRSQLLRNGLVKFFSLKITILQKREAFRADPTEHRRLRRYKIMSRIGTNTSAGFAQRLNAFLISNRLVNLCPDALKKFS